MTTTTDTQIQVLLAEAEAAGDELLADKCAMALAGHPQARADCDRRANARHYAARNRAVARALNREEQGLGDGE